MAEFPGAVKKKLSIYAPNTAATPTAADEVNAQKKPAWTDDTGIFLKIVFPFMEIYI